MRDLSNVNEDVAGLGLEIMEDGNLGTTTLVRGHQAQVVGGIDRYYQITPSYAPTDATLVFHYLDSELNEATEANLKLYKSPDGSDWAEQNSSIINTTENTITLSEISSFSWWTAGDGDDPLPVELTDFSASFSKNNVVLNWTTQSETENLGWNIYRSENENGLKEEDYIQINSELIEGMGTTSQPTDYSFVDENLAVEGHTYYYWLQSVSTTNELEMFDPVSIEIPATNQLPIMTILSKNYPNPFNPETTISFSVKKKEGAVLSIYNLKGQRILKERFDAGKYQYRWNAKGLASGIYFYKLSCPSANTIRKMILLR
jgi:hypothetical protein